MLTKRWIFQCLAVTFAMPEKSLNEVSGRARHLYDRGSAALQRQNYDYAIEMFGQALQIEPGFYDCRESLRAAQFKKSGTGSTGGFFKKVFGTAGQSPLFAKAQIALRTNPVEALNTVELILNSEPASVAAHKLLAEAALAADLPRTAVLSLEIAFKNAPQDRELALRLAQTLAQFGRVVRSEHVYSELQRAFPNDSKIAQALKNVSARRTMSEGGYETLASGEGSYRDILRDQAEAVSLEQQNREVKADDVLDKLIAEYRARIPNEPNNLTLLRSIAELYAKKEDFDLALAYYNRLLATEGENDPSVEKAIADTTVKKFDHAIGRLDSAAPNYPEERARLEKEKEAFQLAECRKRAEKYPHDLQISFELAQLYFQMGQIGDAIREFQKALNHPNRRVAAMGYLGQCFARRGMYDLAARRFQEAIKEKPFFDDEKKDLIYWLGTVLEKMGKREEAMEQFKVLYEVDIGYRDVAAKVDAYYEGR